MARQSPRLMLAFAAVFVVVGIPYWTVPYAKLNLPTALPDLGLFVAAGAALLLCAFDAAPFWKITRWMTATVPAVVIARVLADGVRDPSSHNLWPLEVVIGLLVGLAYVLPGAAAGLVIRVLARRAR